MELDSSVLVIYSLVRLVSDPVSDVSPRSLLWPGQVFLVKIKNEGKKLISCRSLCVQGFFLCSFLSALKFGFLRLLASGVYQPTPLFPFLCCVWPGNTQQGSKLGQSQIQTLFSVFQELFSFHCSVSSILKILVS